MKKLIITVLAISGILFGCAETELPAKQSSLAVEKDSYEYLNTDIIGMIPVVCNINWFASSDQSWCKAVRKNDNVELTMEKNLTVFKRTAKIMISTTIGGLKRPVIITQNGDVPTLIIEKNEYSFEDIGGEVSLNVVSNLVWKVKSDSPTWCTVVKEGDLVKIVVKSTSQTTARQAKITITGEVPGVDKVILVNQKAASFGVDKANFDFTIDAANGEANVTSDVAWTFTTNASWFGVVRDINKLKISVPVNNGPERTGEITITAGNNSAIIYIKQAGLSGLDLDKQALIKIYNSMNGASWTTPWKIDQPLVIGSTNWTGVTISSVGGINRVTSLVLNNRGLSGNIPNEIGYLSELKTLNLGNSAPGNITGVIPNTIGNLTKLSALVLSRNKLTGPIPNELTTLKTLTLLQMHTNLFTGNVPEGLGNLTALTSLELNGNNLTGIIPTGVFGKLTLLGSFKINLNKLSGDIPADMKANPKWSGWSPGTNICPQQATFGFNNCP